MCGGGVVHHHILQCLYTISGSGGCYVVVVGEELTVEIAVAVAAIYLRAVAVVVFDVYQGFQRLTGYGVHHHAVYAVMHLADVVEQGSAVEIPIGGQHRGGEGFVLRHLQCGLFAVLIVVHIILPSVVDNIPVATRRYSAAVVGGVNAAAHGTAAVHELASHCSPPLVVGGAFLARGISVPREIHYLRASVQIGRHHKVVIGNVVYHCGILALYWV